MIKEKGTKRMKIKQQRQINAFLVNLFGNSRGDMLFRQQEELLDTLIRNTENKTKDQMKTLTQTILPRIALYKVLNQSGLSQEDVYRHMRNYMLDIVGTEKHLSMVTYGGLKKLDFSRTKTLGYGGDCCDFHFFRKRS